MKIFEVPLDCNNACFQNSDQSAKRKNFLSAWARKPEGFLLFQGGTGRGKTYTACAVLDSYRKTGKSSARFVNVSDLYIKWKDCFTSQVSEMQLIDRLIDQEILIVDDLGQRTPSEGFMEFLYIVLNKRSNNQHGTIVITNLSSTSLQVKFGDAIFSRVCSGEIIVFEGPDKRNKYSKN
jgi:DNA replication protein DnaC